MKDTIKKVDIYSAVKDIIKKGNTEGVSAELLKAITERMDKDIEQATKKASGSKKETENDKLNANIRKAIVDILTEKGEMVYADLVKTVQGKFADVEISPQKVTANVTKLKDSVSKTEKGKGKEKKLYISLVENPEADADEADAE